MGAVLGLVFAVGVSLALTSPTLRRRAGAGSGRGRRPRPSRPGPVAGRALKLQEAGLPPQWAARSVAAQLGGAAMVALVVAAVTSSWALAAWSLLGAMLIVPVWLRHLGRVRRRELRGVWPDVVDSLAGAIRAGMSIPEAVGDFAESGPEPLREPVRRAMAEFHASGRFDVGMLRLRDDLADPVADRVVEVLRMARDTGGADLGHVLRTLSDMLRQDLRLRAELEARQSWTVNAARVAVAAPWLVLLLLGTSSSVLSTYDTPGGAFVLSVGAVTCLVAYRLMIRLGRISEEGRVLQ